ncbi:D-inositol-3-phosphate glycosyltransferase [Pseudomonas fluorescens]|uniref:D-inositol-3-phosphate glycosyltransferase n=1 Tax=Pseudomonas fluorescens TaxID=294 RepID=A0A5E6PEZ5_PSEFL|nr:glycosyltransferase family 4 protein [Pseudomonas fluorescens]VVM41671.1 D-inositol-3-phosphate glycosyltransferase [Pseudomonas fluorescens]VVO54243.1 D-inositol-3-phosphate glycosyltransferase [Pseudomonas fluorescens]
MTVLNVMWSGGAAYASIHKVHQQILEQAGPTASVKTWLLQGSVSECGLSVGDVREWKLSSARLKGRHFWRLTKPWMQAGFQKALMQSEAHLLLLDGLGVARTLLPLLKTLPRTRAVVIFHGSTRLRAADRELFGQLHASSRLTLVAVSNTLATQLSGDLQLPVMTMRSAFDPASFRSAVLSREQARTRLGLPLDDTPVLGAVGRFEDKKGFACLLEAFASALQQRPELRLVIIGEGSTRAALQARIDHLGLGTRVSLPGHLNEAAQLYSAFDWVAIPSLSEGLGLIMQEAVMAGVPVMSSELAVFREQLDHTGWYVAVDDVSAWSDAIVRAFGVSAKNVAAKQYLELAPDRAWSDFSQVARRLLS